MELRPTTVAVPASSNSQYRPLKDSEIRLASFAKSQALLDRIEPHLQHYELQQAPPYLGLSYVWGDPNVTRIVILNGHVHHVTCNLHDALLNIKTLSSIFEKGLRKVSTSYRLSRVWKGGRGRPQLRLWIDAICINQHDAQEKLKQIPVMGQVYSSAFTTLIWLGTVEDFAPSFVGFNLLMRVLAELLPFDDFKNPVSGMRAWQEASSTDQVAP